MTRKLFRITPSILAAAREYLALPSADGNRPIHVAECFPVPPDEVVRIWEDALFELRRRGADRDFGLGAVTIFKGGRIAAEYFNLKGPPLSLFAEVDPRD
jgi:hypothetical protein